MKKFAIIVLAAALCGNGNFSLEASSSSYGAQQSIQWTTNYTEATQISERTGQPILLFFTGSDWCTWCKKLEHEALDTREFAAKAGNRFIFVMLDFPARGASDQQVSQQNNRLKTKYNIKGFPSIVIVDAKGNRIGSTGYREGGGTPYADHLLAMITSYEKHRDALASLSQQDSDSSDSTDSRYLESGPAATKTAGAAQDDASRLIAKYIDTLEQNDINSKEAIVLRDRLLAVPAERLPSVSKEVAIAEFQALQKNMNPKKLSASTVVAPLNQYMEKYGAQDPEVWRIYMAVSQVYLEANEPTEALKYTEKAAQVAPTQMKKDIDNATQFIRSKLEH
jgi:protein disulfide-isomerase